MHLRPGLLVACCPLQMVNKMNHMDFRLYVVARQTFRRQYYRAFGVILNEFHERTTAFSCSRDRPGCVQTPAGRPPRFSGVVSTLPHLQPSRSGMDAATRGRSTSASGGEQLPDRSFCWHLCNLTEFVQATTAT